MEFRCNFILYVFQGIAISVKITNYSVYVDILNVNCRHENRNELEKLIVRGSYSFDNKVWGRISNEAKDLIMKMLTKNPAERISIEDVLNHNWIRRVIYII